MNITKTYPPKKTAQQLPQTGFRLLEIFCSREAGVLPYHYYSFDSGSQRYTPILVVAINVYRNSVLSTCVRVWSVQANWSLFHSIFFIPKSTWTQSPSVSAKNFTAICRTGNNMSLTISMFPSVDESEFSRPLVILTGKLFSFKKSDSTFNDGIRETGIMTGIDDIMLNLLIS